MKRISEESFYLVDLSPAKQSVVNKDTSELIPNGSVGESCDHGRINPATQSTYHMVRSNLIANRSNRFFNKICHNPVGCCTCNFVDKILKNSFTKFCVRNLWMELNTIKRKVTMCHRCER